MKRKTDDREEKEVNNASFEKNLTQRSSVIISENGMG